MPIFCDECDRAVAFVNETNAVTTFLHVVFSPDGKGYCAHCEAALKIDLSREVKD